MDNFRGFDSLNPADEAEAPDYAQYNSDSEDAAIEAPPVISGDERRMQVRAYNFWTSQLAEKNYPSVEELDPESNEDFRDYSVLLDFTSGMENPSIPFLGEELRQACELGEDITYLDQVPPRSLLSRITDHYLQIIANRAPIGFEAEFVNERGVTIMYRGILLPYSSDDDTIDFIYGVINWKEVADTDVTKEIQAEVEEALQGQPPRQEHIPAWADGPAAALGEAVETVDDSVLSQNAAEELTLGDDFALAEVEPDEDSSLADWLTAARSSADDAREADHRSRAALYRAIGRAWDFALIAEKNPADYAEMLDDSGITAQERAPMTPVVKLVFGANYDKTRLTEFAAALNYAERNAVPVGALADLVSRHDGGLKGIVKAERRARKVARGEHVATTPADPRPRLRNAKLKDLSDFAGPGEEFVILVARRGTDGSLALVGSVGGDAAFTEEALSRTVL
ncbi:MAG: hypothetical protein V3V15_01135 [Sphingorhabdus sp.]